MHAKQYYPRDCRSKRFLPRRIQLRSRPCSSFGFVHPSALYSKHAQSTKGCLCTIALESASRNPFSIMGRPCLEPIVLHCDSWREYGRADPALHSRPERELTQVCMEKAYKFRIYPTSEQETLLQKTFGCARYVYNYYLNKRMTAYQKDKTTLNYYACSADLTRLKKEKDWLREPDKFALQSALRNLDDAYQRFFDRVKKGEAPGYPRLKSKHDRDRTQRDSRMGTSECWISTLSFRSWGSSNVESLGKSRVASCRQRYLKNQAANTSCLSLART